LMMGGRADETITDDGNVESFDQLSVILN